jgi:hypothetical protein
MERATATVWGAAAGDVPDWWPYSGEFPNWHVWRGIAGLIYARRIRSSPPIVVRGTDATDLRDRMRRVEIPR